MMKNLVVKPTVPALILALAMGLALATCADPVRPEPAEDHPEGRGLARIQLSAGEPAQSVRTAVPDMTALYFTLEFTAEGKTPVNETLQGSLSLTLDVALETAVWTLEVNGYTDAGPPPATLTATGSISFSIVEGESASVVVYLTPNVSSVGTGSLGYSIKFPDTVDRAILRLYPMDDTPETSREIDLLDPNAGTLSLTGEIYQMVGTSTLNEGVYRAVIDLYDSVNNKAATRTEVAHIYAGLSTPLERDFVAADFAACPPVVQGPTLADKLAAALSSPEGTYTIVLAGTEGDLGTFNPQTLTVTSKNVNIVLRGNGETVQLDSSGSLFTLGATSGGSLSLELHDITLKGKNGNTASLVRVNGGGTLVMKAGSLITDNISSGSLTGGGVTVAANGTFNMSDGTITGNKAVYGGSGVYVNGGIFNMSGGTISGNEAPNSGTNGSGGGVRVFGGTFNMSDGTISGNEAHGEFGGGGVIVSSGMIVNNGTFTMSGGAVSGNIASGTSGTSGGGGVTVFDGGTFTMSGGAVSGNTAGASASGGGVYVSSNGTFTKNGGGTIYGSDAGSTLKNTASVSGHAVYVSTVSKARNATAGPDVNLDSGTGENWEP
jgi:hypothetical protein